MFTSLAISWAQSQKLGYELGPDTSSAIIWDRVTISAVSWGQLHELDYKVEPESQARIKAGARITSSAGATSSAMSRTRVTSSAIS